MLIIGQDILKAICMGAHSTFIGRSYVYGLAANGKDALTMVNNEQPQLIILEVMMPKMDGYHFCRMLKFDTRFKHIPIIIVSSKIQDADREEPALGESNQ